MAKKETEPESKAADKNNKPGKPLTNEEKFKAPGFFSFIFNRLKTPPPQEENQESSFIKKIGNAISDYNETRERHEKNLNTYELIASSSSLTMEFFVLLLGSAFIATFGLLQNSTAVIIGAMLIAPLMTPILGFSLGSIWGDSELLEKSALTLFVGTICVIALTALLSFIVPGVEMNSEIMGRTNPTLYDILIALASGFVGSYAFINPKISSSISGVAIAVALVPPLSVTGIALGQFDFRAAMGSFLLYASNLVGISLAASFVFWRKKIHPVTSLEEEVSERAKKNFLLSSLVLIIIAVPLGYFMVESFQTKAKENSVKTVIEASIQKSNILQLKVSKYVNTYVVHCTLISGDEITAEKKKALEASIQESFGAPVEIHLIILPGQF